MFKLKRSILEGCLIIDFNKYADYRGIFNKTFYYDFFKKNNLPVEFKEEYYSISNKNVIRGMHFQLPPHQHSKIVCCIFGKIIDVVIDLRKKSSTYGEYDSFTLEEGKSMVYIPEGFAHGFLSLTKNAIVTYKATSMYNSSSDTGIKWNSFGFDWNIDKPILSERDNSFKNFIDFQTPF